MNLSSIVNGILATIAVKDSNATSKYDVDSKQEVEELGRFLNGDLTFNCGNCSVKNLNENDKNLLIQIYNHLKEKLSNMDTSLADGDWNKLYNPHNCDKKEYLNAIKRININNIFAVDITILTNMFTNDITKDKEKNVIFKHITSLLLKKAAEMNLSAEVIKNFKQIIKDCKTPSDFKSIAKELWNYVVRDGRNEYSIQKEIERIQNKQVDPNDDRHELHKYAEKYWVENYTKLEKKNNNFGIGYGFADGDLFLQNDRFKYATTQKTSNCWAMGGLNSMSVHEESKNYMNSLVYKDSFHDLYVVRLPEAENKGFGIDGKGIYIITDEELWKTAGISDGDLDIAAFNLAIKKYFEETGERSEEDDNLSGNSVQRFYEISRGITAKEFDNDEIPDDVGVYKAYAKNSKGKYQKKSDEELDRLYDALINHFSNGGEITLGVTTEIKGHGAHAISVVGIKDDKFIIQESNNNEEYANSFENSWQDENNTWNILLDKETFRKIILSVGTNKFTQK